MSDLPTTKICSICGTRKPLSEYHSRPSARLGVRPECRSCRSRGVPEGKRCCIGCKNVQDLAAFDQRGDGSVSRYCLACRPASRRILHPRPAGGAACSAEEKQCLSCGEVKLLTEYYVAHSAKDGRWGRCIDCERARKGREPVVPMAPGEREELLRLKDRREAMRSLLTEALRGSNGS